MTEYSSDILFERFLDYIELYFRAREELIKKTNKLKLTSENVSDEQIEDEFGDEQQTVNQYRDLAQSAMDSYIRGMLRSLDG